MWLFVKVVVTQVVLSVLLVSASPAWAVEVTPTADPSPSSTSSPMPSESPSADPAATTMVEPTALGECGTADAPCIVQLHDSQFSEVLAALFVLVFVSLVYVLGWLGRKGRG